MSLKMRRYSVLVVSSADSFTEAMKSMLPESGYEPVAFVKTVSAARRASAERDYDFVIINAPLSDDIGINYAIDCSTSGNSLVLFLIQNEIHSEVYSKVSPHGVFTLPKPMSKQSMTTALRWMKTVKGKLLSVEKKSTSIEDKMQEIRLVNKAKWLLIEKENMSEPEAHRYIEKQAMDRCVTKIQIANEIIKNAE